MFHTRTQINILSDVLENTVFCTNIPFKLTGRAFQLLTDIFLFYDFSVENFLQSYKVAILFVPDSQLISPPFRFCFHFTQVNDYAFRFV